VANTQDSWGFEVHINATGTAAGVEDYYADTYGDLYSLTASGSLKTTPGQVTGGTRLTTALAGTSAAARMAGNATTSDTVAGSAASEGTLTGSTTATTITGG